MTPSESKDDIMAVELSRRSNTAKTVGFSGFLFIVAAGSNEVDRLILRPPY